MADSLEALELDPARAFQTLTRSWRRHSKQWVDQFDTGQDQETKQRRKIINWGEARGMYVAWTLENHVKLNTPEKMHMPYSMWVLCRSTIKKGLERKGWVIFPTVTLDPNIHYLEANRIDKYVLAQLPLPTDDRAYISLLADLANIKTAHSKKMAENGEKATQYWIETRNTWRKWARETQVTQSA